jgi:DNA polymerase I-like protein with 3'-5' exonuclease and polymerase domains
VDKDQLIILSTQHPDKAVIQYTAKHRKVSKLVDTIFSPTRKIKTGSGSKIVNTISSDGRVRCQYDPCGTKTGRLNSTTNPFGGGYNMHTVPRKDKHPQARQLIMPDPGMYFVNADLEQAELRVVAYLAKAMELIDLLEKDTIDIHTYMAKEVLKLVRGHDIDTITYEERQLGKKNVHGSNYLMGADTFVKTCRTELEINITRTQAQQIRKGYYTAYPEIPNWHKYVEYTLKTKNITLTTPLGRTRVFYDAWKDVLKAAVAFLPQSTVGDLLSLIWLKWERNHKYGQMLLTNHDALAFQIRKENIKPGVEEIRRAFHYPVMINRMEMLIPVDVKVYDVWEGQDVTKEVLG